MIERRGQLFLVPTPIGNLGDVTSRSLEVLGAVDAIACEDTRNSGSLLKHFDIKKKLLSYHNFNESSRAEQLIEMLESGQSVAVITDGGSPGISDPAYRVVRAALDHGIDIIPLPGPTALIPALTASGLPTDRFFFEGFLPQKPGPRRHRLEELADYPHTLIFYESPFRVQKSLQVMLEVLGDRHACLAREISKKFEEFIRGTVSSILQELEKRTVKGEIVLVIEGLSRKLRSEKEDSE